MDKRVWDRIMVFVVLATYMLLKMQYTLSCKSNTKSNSS